MELFSEYFEKLLELHPDYFDNGLIKGAYLIGAYSKSIINNSLYSEVSSGNKTFEKWLSNQKIIEVNLKKIFNKANEFERKLRLGNFKDSNLSQLVTTHFNYDKNTKISQQEISYAFIRGFNDYAKFKREAKEIKKGE
ncbi:hypothetical protein [Campylobacter sp. RM16187]|uniref:hypothetical protein n=1 Tax=Campylobacter sp. RM16187 TaxID=1660063 RepID=UPI0021B65414|nr:hypothetical protein [Campylobacter sp. RM16187]QKG30217.1 hypothetical protein CDOMF_1998 [Campylobacter sp. RM16187]